MRIHCMHSHTHTSIIINELKKPSSSLSIIITFLNLMRIYYY